MNTPTYKEQFDKITRAYMDDKLNPMNSCACFIGNLLNGNGEWANGRSFELMNPSFPDVTTGYVIHVRDEYDNIHMNMAKSCLLKEANGFYSLAQIVKMERLFLTIWKEGYESEDALFHAMESTLEMLKQIHISKGEIVDPIPFTKRQLTVS